jgi:integrase
MPRPPSRKQSKPETIQMPKGFYLKRGIWYKRIRRPHPVSGQWIMAPESTGCSEKDRQAAIDYVERRNRELGNARELRQTTDPAKITVAELLDDFLYAQPNEEARKHCEYLLIANIRPFFAQRLAQEINRAVCRAYRLKRRADGVADTTINRELSKVSQAFKVGRRLGKIDFYPPGGCDFMKDPERKNTRLVRLPDRYYSVFREALHPALRCFFVVDYNIGRRKVQLLNTTWEQVNFDERHIFFPSTKNYPNNVKAPFFGEMERCLREQLALRNQLHPECPWVFFWFGLRNDKNGERIKRFSGLWKEAIAVLNERLRVDGKDPKPVRIVAFNGKVPLRAHRERAVRQDPTVAGCAGKRAQLYFALFPDHVVQTCNGTFFGGWRVQVVPPGRVANVIDRFEGRRGIEDEFAGLQPVGF